MVSPLKTRCQDEFLDPTAGGARFIGQPIRRREDPHFLRGETRYVDDIELPRMVHAVFVRSPHAHALVRHVELGRVSKQEGFVTALAGAQVRDLAKPIRCDSTYPEFKGSDWPVLAWDRVRFVGEAVAAIVGPNRYVAEDLAETVEVSYEPLEPVVDLDYAITTAPPFHAGWSDNLFIDRSRVAGDVETAFRDADHVFEATYRIHRHLAYPLEPRACLADYSPANGALTLYSATQIPHLVRSKAAEILGLPEHRLRVISPDVGGGFGAKAQLFPEEIVVCLLAMRLGRPVKWIEDSREHLMASVHARDQRHVVALALKQDGTILGVKADVIVDVGAYSVFPWSATQDGGIAAAMITAPYTITNVQTRVRCVATNKTPFGAYRGVGRPAGAFTIERAIDDAARELRIDPVAMRLRNHVPDDAYPYSHANGHVYDNASLVATLRHATEMIGYEEFRRQQTRLRAQGRHVGIGFGAYIEQTGHTHEFVQRGTPISFAYEQARVTLDPSGRITIHTSLHSHGQGHQTTFAQVAADHLGVPLDHIRVEFGDTESAPYGMGTFASRGAVLGSGAVAKASDAVRVAIMRMGSHLLESNPQDLLIRNGVVTVKGTDHSVTVEQIARLAFHRPERLPSGLTPADFSSTQSYDAAPGTGAWANAVHVAIVEVDIGTGVVTIPRYVVVEDCGTVINPMIADGQVHGGVVQGIGGTLLERIVYDEAGQPLATTMMDYLLPNAEDIPDIEVKHLQTPSPFTESGIKGLGEGGAIGPMAAIGNAVTDALVPLGVIVRSLPLTPDRVLAMIEQAPGMRAEVI
jgi:carbon-monoxide dehydrogenase large subunit